MSLGQMVKTIKAGSGSPLLVTPKIEAFLMENPEGVIWDEDGYALFQQIIKATYGSNSDRSGRFGASSIGRCKREQIFKFLGMPEVRLMSVDTANLFADGKWRHIRWQMMGVQSGALTHAEYPLSLPKYRLKSSADGLNSIDCFLFELKGDRNMRRLMDKDGNVDEKHNLQIHTMMLMTGWDICSYLMEDKGTQQFREVVIHRDPNTIRLIKQELEELNGYVEDRRLPEILPSCAAKEGPYRSCPFARECLQQRYWPDVPGQWDWD